MNHLCDTRLTSITSRQTLFFSLVPVRHFVQADDDCCPVVIRLRHSAHGMLILIIFLGVPLGGCNKKANNNICRQVYIPARSYHNATGAFSTRHAHSDYLLRRPARWLK